MALTYERCWSREQIRDAKAFIFANAAPVAAEIPGFCDVVTTDEAASLLATGPVIYTVARDAGAVVAAHAVQELPAARREAGHKYEGIRWRVAAYTADPSYDPQPLFWNMMQLLASAVMTEGDGWAASVPSQEAVAYLMTMPWADRTDEPQVDVRGVEMQTVFGTVGTPRPMIEVGRV